MNIKLILVICVLILLFGCSKCPTKPDPPCGTTGSGEIAPTAIGTLTYDSCKCPDGTYDSGNRDTITTPGTVYKMCLCNQPAK